MAKLGKNARKFSKKNLQSVHRRQRKNKVLFKKRSSSKNERDAAKVQVAKRENPNGRSVHDEVFENVSLNLAFTGYDNNMIEDASDSDGYLSEDITTSELDTEPGNIQEDNNFGRPLPDENQIVAEDLAVKKKKLETLKKKNPNFCKFLERCKGADVHKKGAMNEGGSSERSKHFITDTAIRSWCQLIKGEHRRSALVSILNAYRTACHYGAESVGHQFQSSDAFCNLVLFVLSEADNLIHELLKMPSSNSKEKFIMELTNNSKSKNVKPLIKSYLRSTLFLLHQVTDSDILAFILVRLKASLVFFAAFPSLLRSLTKASIHLWATGGGAVSSASFLVIRDICAIFTSECFEDCLAKTLNAYLSQSRVPEIVNIKQIQFLRNSLCDLFSLDVERCSKKATISVCQLANIFKLGMHTNKREVVKKICSWEYMNCVDLWVEFVSANIRVCDLSSLFFTMVQLINGVACMFSGPRYFPLRLKCIRWLNRLASSSGSFVPVTSFVLDALEYKMIKEDGKQGSVVNVDSVLKLPKHCLKTKVFQEESIFSVIEQLSAHFTQWSYHISFPELATVPIIRLKKFYEVTNTESLKRIIKRLIDQIEQNVDFVQKKRDEVAFSPNDHQSVESFLQLEKSSSNAPFTQYFKSVLDKAALRTSKRIS
ncbi:unnamed protein product [Cuscuta epithymum]|uniref:Nucleolar complex protein 2 homolog n=2 Tax=Cuscuta epithymum TaxID=186058 RepID=A0AAV0CPY9_9ASTE|nr:unnamed protein product [Cuscuta epithymum]